MLALVMLAIPFVVLAAPVYDAPVPAAEDTFQPLVLAFTLLPFPLLAVLKYTYLRFRRGHSIHTTDIATTTATSPSLSSSLSSTFHPYLVGIFGSPDWETTIICRLQKTIRRAHTSPDSSPNLGCSTRTTRSTEPSSGFLSISTKSRATCSSSRSRNLSASGGDRSRHRHPNDFAVMPRICPSPPPRLQLPPPAHFPNSSVRFSNQEHSPTLMQVMEPVLSSFSQDSSLKPPLLLINDQSLSSSASSQDKSTSTEDLSLPFFTPLASPASTAAHLSLSTPAMPFAHLRKRQCMTSTTSSMFTISAVSALSSPASVSIAVFHSPVATSIPVPKPVYTPSLRPESCVVLPRDWHNEQEHVNVQSLLHSPTHCSPPSDMPTLFDYLFATQPTETTALQVARLQVSQGPSRLSAERFDTASQSDQKSATILKAIQNGMVSSPIVESVQNSAGNVKSSAASVASPGQSGRCKSWDLDDLAGGDGKLDVDAVTRALGIGLGLAFRNSAASVLSGTESESAVSAMLTPVPEIEDEEVGETSGLGPDRGSTEDDAGGMTGMVSTAIDMHMRMHGQPLCVIPEETRSEVGSILSRRVSRVPEELDLDGEVSMELDSGIVGCEALRRLALESRGEGDGMGDMSSRVSVLFDQSWIEGESSVGVAW